MLLNAKRVDVWAADLQDKPGALAEKLKGLAKSGANLQFIIARRRHAQPGTGVVFVTPLEGDQQLATAQESGFTCADGLCSVRVEGPDEPGISYELTDALAQSDINLRGISAARIGSRAIFYLAFDQSDDADKAVDIINRL